MQPNDTKPGFGAGQS